MLEARHDARRMMGGSIFKGPKLRESKEKEKDNEKPKAKEKAKGKEKENAAAGSIQ